MLTALVLTGLMVPHQALAEVCDKVVAEHWRRSDGPEQTILDPPVDFIQLQLIGWVILFAVPATLTLAALALQAALSKRAAFLATWGLKWVGYAVAAFVTASTLYAVATLWLPEDYGAMLAAAAREGCIVLQTNWLRLWSITGTAAGVLLLSVWTAYRVHCFERAAEARYRGSS